MPGAGIALPAQFPLGPEFNQNGQWFRAFGRNPAISGAPETVWDLGGVYPYPDINNPQTWEVLSDNAADSPAGTGADNVRVFGVGGPPDFLVIVQQVNLDGTTPVVFPIDMTRIFRAFVLTAGSATFNVGQIEFQPQGGGTSIAAILPTRSTTQMAVFTVTGFLRGGFLGGWYGSVGAVAPTDVELALRFRSPGTAFETRDTISLNSHGAPFFRNFVSIFSEGAPRVQALIPNPLPPGSDIELTVTNASGPMRSVEGAANILLLNTNVG